MRDSRTRTSANSAATKKPLSPTSTRARKRLARDNRGSTKARDPRGQPGRAAGVGGWLSEVRPSRYERYYTVATRPDKLTPHPFSQRGVRPQRPVPSLGLLELSSLGEPFGLVLAQETFEESPVALLVAQDVYHHVLCDQVDLIGH